MPPALTRGSPSMTPSASNEPPASVSSVLCAIVLRLVRRCSRRGRRPAARSAPNVLRLVARLLRRGRGIGPGCGGLADDGGLGHRVVARDRDLVVLLRGGHARLERLRRSRATRTSGVGAAAVALPARGTPCPRSTPNSQFSMRREPVEEVEVGLHALLQERVHGRRRRRSSRPGARRRRRPCGRCRRSSCPGTSRCGGCGAGGATCRRRGRRSSPTSVVNSGSNATISPCEHRRRARWRRCSPSLISTSSPM